MATMPSEPMDWAHEVDTLCRWGIRAAWYLSLSWGALVSLLSWTSGAAAATAIVRGLVTFVAFGLVGWGVSAVMVQAGHQAGGASATEAEAGLRHGVADETADSVEGAGGAPPAPGGEGAPAIASEGYGPGGLPEAA